MVSRKPTLQQVIAELLASNGRRHITLSRGLTIAYTPAELNNGRFRLTLSRRSGEPSPQEAVTVRDGLCSVLARQGKNLDGLPTISHDWIIKQRNCTLIQWREYEQRSLFEESSAKQGGG